MNKMNLLKKSMIMLIGKKGSKLKNKKKLITIGRQQMTLESSKILMTNLSIKQKATVMVQS